MSSACRRLGGIFDVPRKEARLDELDRASADSALWDDPARAQSLLKERTRLSEIIARWEGLVSGWEDADAMLELAVEAKDHDTAGETREALDVLDASVRTLELERMLSGPNDHDPCYLQINAGAGGTESMDWAGMLQRMYLRWCDRVGYKVKIVDQSFGEEAGIKSALLAIDGAAPYGHLRSETGVHRLVRISPFDASARRHTSFASVFIYPQADEDIDIEINDGDLRVDTYRASGAGGQHVNKTDSAVRITHLPTSIVVQCQNERSQHKNRATAMKILQARLVELERQKQREEWDAMQEGKMSIDFGSQIRSYVLQPYQLVKDLRTNVETGGVDAVLDGDIDAFIEAYLLQTSSENPA